MDIKSGLQLVTFSIKHNLLFSLFLLSSLWIIQFVNQLLKQRLCLLGIYPRKIWGVFGIFFSPFLHGSYSHLLFNSIPLFVLANFILVYGRPVFFTVSLLIIVISGLAIWLLGRRGYHIGASSLVMGYLGFLIANAYLHHSFIAILFAFICIYYLGGLFLNLFPTEARTSWEGHVFGFLAGIGTAYLFPLLFFK